MNHRPIRAIERFVAWSTLAIAAPLLGGWLVACTEVYADPVTTPFTFGSPSDPGADPNLGVSRLPPFKCPARVSSVFCQANARCEYGGSPDPACNDQYACDNEFLAKVRDDACGTTCPDQIVDGAPCDMAVLGDAGTGPETEVLCQSGGATCACTTGRDGAHAHERRWVCSTPAADCPSERPMLGQPCIGAHSCDYGSCTSKRGQRMICEDEVWQTEVGKCE